MTDKQFQMQVRATIACGVLQSNELMAGARYTSADAFEGARGEQFRAVVDAIVALIKPEAKPKRKVKR